MKKHRLSKLLFVLFLMLASTQLIAQNANLSEHKLNRAINNCVMALNSNNDGLIESALFKIILFNHQFPNVNYDKIVSELDKLTLNGKSTRIRQKAFITKLYIENPDMFKNVKFLKTENDDENFKLITDKLESNIFVSN